MDFWDVFWLLLIFIPLLLVWAFTIVDIFQREDLAGWFKAVWVLVVLVLPFIGTFVYLIFRPRDTARDKTIAILSELHERGRLSDEEYTAEMARLLGRHHA